jgi:hypothetical protein
MVVEESGEATVQAPSPIGAAKPGGADTTTEIIHTILTVYVDLLYNFRTFEVAIWLLDKCYKWLISRTCNVPDFR